MRDGFAKAAPSGSPRYRKPRPPGEPIPSPSSLAPTSGAALPVESAEALFLPGSTRFNMTAVKAVPGTPLKNIDTQSGKLASASGCALNPSPTANDTATMVVVRASGR